MTLRPTLALLAFLLLSGSAQASPKRVLRAIASQFREHPTRTALILGGVAAGVHAGGLRHCRQGSVENCQAKYGAAWASYGAATGINFVVVASTSGCWRDQSKKFCSLFAYSGSAAQLGFGINQWKKKGGEHETHVDLSRIAFIRKP
jgi:hypothetical protein